MKSVRLVTAIALTLTLTGAVFCQVTNPSFEDNFGVPAGWSNGPGSAQVGLFPDVGMPTDGGQYLLMLTSFLGPATPHSNEGGFGTAPTNTSNIQQTFSPPNAGDTLLQFDVVFLSNEPTSRPDFFEAEIQDASVGGNQWYNAVHLDTNDLSGPASFFGIPSTGIVTVSIDLGAVFPAATSMSSFTLRFHVGNAIDTSNDSRCYVDNIRFTPGTPFPNEPRITWTLINGGATMKIAMDTPGLPFTEVFNLVSFSLANPVGSGTLLGLAPSALTFQLLTFPIGTNGVHVLTDATGHYEFTFPSIVFSGQTLDSVMVGLPGGVFGFYTGVSRVTFP